MKIIPFDVEKAKSSKYKIQTVTGHPVRIICWDRKGTNPHKEYPIVGLINIDGIEREQVFNTDGGIFDSGSSTLDLVLVDESIPNLPKWKFIKKGKKLPEMAYVKTKAAGICHIPAGKGNKVGCDCWYLPATVIDGFENEV